jgi:hypothetical protein
MLKSRGWRKSISAEEQAKRDTEKESEGDGEWGDNLGHRPRAGSGLLPRLPPPTCSRPVSGAGLGLFCAGFFPAVSLPLLFYSSSLCDL